MLFRWPPFKFDMLETRGQKGYPYNDLWDSCVTLLFYKMMKLAMVHLFVPHELLCPSMLFKMLTLIFSTVIDEVCWATIGFLIEVWISGWGNRRLTIGTRFLTQILDRSPLVCFKFFFFILLKQWVSIVDLLLVFFYFLSYVIFYCCYAS